VNQEESEQNEVDGTKMGAVGVRNEDGYENEIWKSHLPYLKI